MADINKLAAAILGGVQDFVRRTLEPWVERVKALEAREPIAGEKGADGAPGASGPEGPAGKDGAPGSDGAPGQAGAKGDQGDPGVRGEKGADGINGLDGGPGQQGHVGAAGEPGERGPKGDPGEPGGAGERGAVGKDGAPGPQGQKGDPGASGAIGEPGRDAAQIEILDGIESTKSYHRGTFVTHRGGLVRSFRATDPLADGAELEKAGWHVVVRGIDDIALELGADGRTLGVAIRYTDGRVVQKSVRVPAMIDRGIWKDGPFDAGDVTTWDGSQWTAQRTTLPGEKPGDDSGAWRLCVKRGRDGRDGLKGEKGERGAEGRAGKDLTQLGADGAKW